MALVCMVAAMMPYTQTHASLCSWVNLSPNFEAKVSCSKHNFGHEKVVQSMLKNIIKYKQTIQVAGTKRARPTEG